MQNRFAKILMRLWEIREMANDLNDSAGDHLGPDQANQQFHSLRFVVHHHTWPHPHWDWMLEKGGQLITFRSAPDTLHKLLAGTTIPLTALPTHRLLYLDYEGPVSNNRGVVQRVFSGNLTWLSAPEGAYQVQLSSPHFSVTLLIHAKTESHLWEACPIS